MNYTIEQFRADLSDPYVWPGGYPRFFICSDGGCLTFKAAKEEQELIEQAIEDNDNSGWRVIGCEINWEDNSLYCDHTGEKIKSAYAED